MSTTSDSAPDVPENRRPGGFFFRRRLVPLPTWRLWLLLLVLAGGAGWFTIRHLFQWLAVSEPVEGARFLAVEGWMPDYALKQATDYAGSHNLRRVYCTGVPLDRGTMFSEMGTNADYAARTMVAQGASAELVRAAPAELVRVERTRTMARALGAALKAENVPAGERRINLVTLSTHARRSWGIYQEELGKDWQVGVISVAETTYDPGRWYLESGPAKNVMGEMIALGMGIFGAN